MTQFKLVEPEDSKKRMYRTDLDVYAYIRFSTMEQVKNSLQSKKMQDTRMSEKLQRIGWIPDRIRVKDKDEGISAQKGTDVRTDLADIYKAMKDGLCGAIAAYDASRLWRDRDHVFYNDFIMKIKKYNVPVILHNKTYWPDVKSDMESLREEFRYAQKQLEQNYEKANPARQEAVLSGSYGGHCIPMGFVIVGEKGAKKYAIYEPHAKLIRWLFKRYRQLNGNLGRLGRELVAADFHFPDFDRDALRAMGADVPHVGLIHDAKGYRLYIRNGIIGILTNRAYLGWYVYEAKSEESRVFQGEYVNKESHDAVVGMDDFMFAYSRLSDKTLDGEPNESKPAVNRHYSQVNALLEGLLTTGKAPMYAMRTGNYIGKVKTDGWQGVDLVVGIQHIDSIFARAMIDTLHKIEIGSADKTLTEKVEALTNEKEEQADSLTERLANIDKATRQWEIAKQAAMAEESIADTQEAIRNLKRLRADREAIEQKAKQATSEVEELAECKYLLGEAKHRWNSMKFEKQRRLVKLIVGSANVVEIAPHFLQLSVCFNHPVDCDFVCYTYRTRGSKSEWSNEENRLLGKLYPQADRRVILESLPTRTWASIIVQATKVLHIERHNRANTSGIVDGLTYADVCLLNQLEPLSQMKETHTPLEVLLDLYDNALWTIEPANAKLEDVNFVVWNRV